MSALPRERTLHCTSSRPLWAKSGHCSATNAAVLSRAISGGSYRSFSRSISIRILRANVTGELEEPKGAIFWRPSAVVTVTRPPKAE